MHKRQKVAAEVKHMKELKLGKMSSLKEAIMVATAPIAAHVFSVAAFGIEPFAASEIIPTLIASVIMGTVWFVRSSRPRKTAKPPAK